MAVAGSVGQTAMEFMFSFSLLFPNQQPGSFEESVLECCLFVYLFIYWFLTFSNLGSYWTENTECMISNGGNLVKLNSMSSFMFCNDHGLYTYILQYTKRKLACSGAVEASTPAM